MVRETGQKKTKVRVTLDNVIVRWLDESSEEGKFSRSDVVNEYLRALRERDKSLKFRLDKIRTKATELCGETSSVLISMKDDHLKWLDKRAEEAEVSRSEVLTESILAMRAFSELLNRVGLTAVRRRRIARAIGLDFESLSADEEDALEGETKEA